jgi:uncharacterized protein
VPPSPVRAKFKGPPEAQPAPAAQQQPAATNQTTVSDAIGDKLVPVYEVSIDGAPMPTSLAEAMHSVEVQQSLSLVDMAILTFDNPHGAIGDADCLACGKEIEIKVGYLGAIVSMFKGDIVAIEPVYPIEGNPSVRIRAYDRAHRLRRGRKTRTFLKQKISDIAKTIASEEGLSPDIEDTAVQHDYIIQNNQSNIDFLHELSRRYFVEARVVEPARKLVVKKPQNTQGPAKTLKWGNDIKSFYCKKSTANVPTEVEARTWDVTQKKMTSSKATAIHGQLGASSIVADAKKAFGDAKRLIAIRPTADPREAKAMAESILNEEAMGAVKGHGTCVGDTDIIPGIVIELEALGAAWSGKYYVTGATHVVHRVSGYSTQFEVKRNG